MGIVGRIKSLFSRETHKAAAPNTREIDAWKARVAAMRASYDAARTSSEFENYWANSDALDADSANSREIRHKLIHRSRYEWNNNGFSDGIAKTYCDDLVGVGPTLRMQSGSEGFNRMVERVWWEWSKAIGLRRKLWTMSHAKHSDGEGLGIIRRNPRVKHAIKLDVQLVEAEQCQTPYLRGERGYIDGIKFDAFGNPEYYDILREHPGCTNRLTLDIVPERVPAAFVLHWFKSRRPGQHRGVPEMASTLNTGAAARRWREAMLGAAETIADYTLFIKTTLMPDQVDLADPMSTLDINKRMLTALPAGYDAFQPRAEQPAANHESFNRALIGEQARPKGMSYSRAAADNSASNFAGGKLDQMPYFAGLEVEREDCNDLILDPLFDAWLDQAIVLFRWFGGDPTVVTAGAGARAHSWDWPELSNADQKAEADANKTKLQSGQLTLSRLYSNAGLDLEDEIVEMAKSFGVTEDEIRERLFDIVLPPDKQGGSPNAPDESTAVVPESLAAAILSRGSLNGNGVHHG